MKKNTLLFGFLVCTSITYAQVGVNTITPTATLEVVGKGATTTSPDGIIAPRISKQQLAAKTAGTYGSPQTAAVVFVNDVTTPTGTTPSLAQVAGVTTIGYYYFDGSIWKAISGTPTTDTSIYLNDGTLAGNRIVTQGASTLTFNATAANAFSVDGTSLSVDAANHRAGFGTAAPAATVDVVGKAATTTVPDGIVAPRISKQQLAAKTAGTYGAPQTAAVVFVNDVTTPTGTIPSVAQVAGVTSVGYYYFDGSIWKAIGGTPTVDTNIYLNDGTLTGNRTVNQAGLTLAFTGGTTANSFSVNGSSLSVDALNDRVGIGTTAPLTKLHVVASAVQSNRYNLIDAPASTNQYALIALRNTSPIATGNYSLLGFTNNGTAAGGANWGLGSIRTGAASTTGSEEDFYIGNSLGGTLLERFRISSAGNVGIGTSLPQRPLHVNANTGPIRLENLASLAANTASSGLVIDANGDVYKNNTVSVEGQVMRIGLNAATYSTAGEVGVRFSTNDSAAEMVNAPNGAPNFINTIVGATLADNVSAVAGQGSVARTTDQITLQPGVYKLQVRLVGNFAFASSSNNLFLKAIVNNNEYSLVNAANNNNQSSIYYFDDYINITGSAQTVDFSILPAGNSFTVSSNASPGTGNSYRSLILIQRLR